MAYATADLCDAHPEVQVCEPLFSDFGGELAFCGPIATLKVYEDNALVRSTLERPGQGRVLVVDGGGSLRCALVGGSLGALGAINGWSGIVVNGCVRDCEELATRRIGVKALTSLPRKSEKGAHGGHADRAVSFAGAVFRPGAWLYADSDGIIIAERPIHR
ncbi:MAG: ribonuclease E activity regulator RraA [Gammaproteobacteria bacterium]|nr:ribonuclease E activity regulator RraA [Gammaproteobacteria bacterium]